MKTRTSTLLPPELDYWVAKAENVFYMRDNTGHVFEIDQHRHVIAKPGPERMYYYQPSADWRLGGPIIDKHDISVQKSGSGWIADRNRECTASGDTALIAAMRVRVMMAYGDSVEDDG